MHDDRVNKSLFSLWIMSSELVLLIEKKIRPLGLTIHDMRALIILGERGEMSPSALAESLGVTNGAVTGIVQRLLKVGAISSKPGGPDRRTRVVTIQYSQLDTVLLDAVTIIRQLYTDYSEEDMRTIEQHHQNIIRLIEQTKITA